MMTQHVCNIALRLNRVATRLYHLPSWESDSRLNFAYIDTDCEYITFLNVEELLS
jgi:hypothetical protein